MKYYFLCMWMLLVVTVGQAQPEKTRDIFAFKITDYTVPLNDSTVVVQLELTQPGLGIAKNETGVLNGNFSNTDTGYIGGGKCHLIKSNYYYYAIKLANKKRLPKKGDLLYTKVTCNATYRGLLFNLIRHGIYLQPVFEGEAPFYNIGFALSGDQQRETMIIDSLVADIKYTGKEMMQQNNSQNAVIATGRFKSKKIFSAMQEVNRADVTDFLSYMIARPVMYAGSQWKISEVFATWINGGAPTVIR